MRLGPQKVVVVGGVAAGPKVASKVIRLLPQAKVTIIEKDKLLSYAGCGLPYYVSGVVKKQSELMATPVGVVRDPVFFHRVKNVDVINRTEATQILRDEKKLRIKNLDNGTEDTLDYDKLVLATGATPVRPSIPGVDLDNIFCLHGMHDAEGIKRILAAEKARDVVVVGGGLIGVEITEALQIKGSRVTIVEMLPQVLNMLDWEIARIVEQHMESKGVKVLTRTQVMAFQGNGKVNRVATTKGDLPADLVILAIGVRPNVKLAKEAGLTLGLTGAIQVDGHMQTSDKDIYAAGDCVETKDLLTQQPCYVPLGSTANKMGRVAAVNLTGGDEVFPGVLGSSICKVFDHCVGRTGLTEKGALLDNRKVISVYAPSPDKAHFMPEAQPLLLKMTVCRNTRRVLGLQVIGPGSGDKRVDIAVTAITAGLTVDQVANLDLAYAPPYAPAMDNIISAANIARNILDGHMDPISAQEVWDRLLAKEKFFFLDVRGPGEYAEVRLPGTTLIPLGTLRERLDEVPQDQDIVVFCKISLRGYEAALILKAAGFKRVQVLGGGVVMWPFAKETNGK